MESFDIPIVLFFFKRDKIVKIINRLSVIQPRKLYLISDEGRTYEEKLLVKTCRELVESSINWECSVIKNYAKENKGVYDRIGEGAKWVFGMESEAIFLEDDNLPDTSFFPFCKELLERYKFDTRILWICGTNYMRKYISSDNNSYMFTKHLLPCGWASWSSKFMKFYDGSLSIMDDKYLVDRIKLEYKNKQLADQQIGAALRERKLYLRGMRMNSWDYQMAIALHANGLLGISPKYNLIENIGADNHSIHGGVSYDNIMTRRFCGITTSSLEFPLNHPRTVLPDIDYENKVAKIILHPLKIRIRSKLGIFIRQILCLSEDDPLSLGLRKIFQK